MTFTQAVSAIFGRSKNSPVIDYPAAPGLRYTYRALSTGNVVCGVCFTRGGGFEPPTVLRTFEDTRIPADRCDRCSGRAS